MAGPPPPMPPAAYGMPPPMPMQQRTMLPMVGGIMLLIAGIISISFWGYIIALGTAAVSLVPIPPEMAGTVVTILVVCGSIAIIISLITLLGGVMAMQRKMWGLALAGGILGLFTLGWFALGSILSLIGLILVAVSRREFR